MRKWGFIALVCSALLFIQTAAPGGTAIQAAEDKPITVLLNGVEPELGARPFLKDVSVYVPLRGLLTALGAQVLWDERTEEVTTKHNGNEIVIMASSNQAKVNGKSVTLDRPPLRVDGTSYVSVRWLNETFGAVVKWHAASRTVSVYYPDEQLPSVGSLEHLRTLLADASDRQVMTSRITVDLAFTSDMVATTTSAPSAESKSTAANAASDAGDAYSSTNVQVQGVDEADVVKTDGRYIYQVNRQRILITSAKPADRMNVVATLKYADGSFAPQEIYVDEHRLIVIGNGGNNNPYTSSIAAPAQEQPAIGAAESKRMIMPIMPYVQTTVAIVYDLSDMTSPREVRRLELEGGYLSSRKIGDSLYLITNKYLNYYGIAAYDENPAAADSLTPMVRDSSVHDKLTPIDIADIRYFPGFIEPTYMLVAGVDLASSDQPMDVQTFLGSGNTVYASAEHLYVAVSRYEEPKAEPANDAQPKLMPVIGTTSTVVYKFALNPSGVVYMAEGKVPGTILNQFSMDEHNGYFRIATTSGDMWMTGDNTSKNNLYVLGDALQQIGKIEDIAPGERIYSVRFAGDRAYMVTFRTVDPLFVIDVADPAAPTILGALKIPGYSDYLHPYDENHIIGFGKDTVEVSNKDNQGNVISTSAYYLGMKVALFDVTDVANPKELHKLNIGDRGTQSELLYNHKALLFNKDLNLLAFPVDLYEVNNGETGHGGMPAYGTFAYQGAYVYKLDPASGFQLRGRITHMSQDELAKAGNYWAGDKSVRRILYIGDTLYTMSDGMIKANAFSNLQELGKLNLPQQ